MEHLTIHISVLIYSHYPLYTPRYSTVKEIKLQLRPLLVELDKDSCLLHGSPEIKV